LPGFQPDDAAQGQHEFVLAMRVHGHLRAPRNHLAAERGDGTRYVLGVEIDGVIGAEIAVIEPEEGHGVRMIDPGGELNPTNIRPTTTTFNASRSNLDGF
jgi:hypothetical protein